MTRTSADLERRIDYFAPRSASILACGDELRRHGFRVCTFEDLDLSAEHEAFACQEVTLGEALRETVERNPGYRWEVVLDALVNIVPVRSVLDQPAPPMEIRGKSLGRVLREDLGLGEHGIGLFLGLTVDGPPIELVARPRDFREALNLIVAQIPDTIWHISGRESAYSIFLTVVEAAT